MKTVVKVVAALWLAAAPGVACAQGSEKPIEKPDVSVAIGTWVLQYLPLPVAEAKGFFTDEGLRPHIINFNAGGSKALQALIGGSTDTVVGFYDHTIRMQALGKNIRCVTLLAQMPGLVLAVRKDLAGTITGIGQLSGRRIGVTSLGSSTDFLARYLLQKAGMRAGGFSIVPVGSGATAIAAIEQKAVDAIVTQDPAATLLFNRGLITSLIDTRTLAGNDAAFGGLDPTACLYATEDFIQRNPVTIQHLVNAFNRSLAWIARSTPQEIADVMPKAYELGDTATFVSIVEQSKQEFPPTGAFKLDDLERAMHVVQATDEKVAASHTDIARTYTNEFNDAVPPAAR